jgi:hypothetical protein
MENTKEKTENPGAFPSDWDIKSGMTLRDYFAAKAMQAILTHENIGLYLKESGAKTMEDGDRGISITSYRLADAMLKERQKQNP